MIIEVYILDKLSAALSVPVYAERPDNPPDSFVVVDKTGSSQKNRLTTSTIAFQSYAPSKYAAASLNETVKAAVDALAADDELGAVKLNSDYPFPDLAIKRHRYQAVYDIYHY